MEGSLNYLLEHGLSLDEIERLKERDGLTVDQLAEAAESIISRGESLTGAVLAPEWEEPIPFETVNTPDFPTECLPGVVSSFVECLAESTQTPEEMAGILSLGVLATAFQSKYEVEITPDWREPLCLYPVAVAPPGERKSAVISALTKPIYEYEAERREAEAVEIAQNQTERALLERALQAAQTQATKKKGNFDAGREEALSLSAQLAEFQDKHPFRLLVDDTTPEKLVDIMDTQDGCITVASAEGGVFDSMAGRYDKGANFDIYLKGHAGDPITVDRIGRKPNHIKSPRLTMLLTIQPEVLSGLMNNPTMRGRGLCGRFLYVMCKSKVGRRDVSPPAIPLSVKAEYRLFVRRILADPGSGIIRLSPEADEIRKQYQDYIEKKLGNEWEFMRDWGGKLVGAMVRIAALMHAAQAQEDPTEIPISPDVMAGAASVAEFLSAHAVAAYQVMGADEQYADAKYLWHRIESTGQNEITKRDLYQLSKGKFKTVEELDPVVSMLSEMGYIREIEQKTGGRPSKKLIVNPATKSPKSPKRASA
ncbi:MAG: YfjI family protein [Pseudoflavonifractor sp.]|nr:YfjI family protein [Pseudoflavonifractor sp.]